MLATSTPIHAFANHTVAKLSLSTFENLFKQYYTGLRMHALNYVADATLAEDIVSEVFGRIWERRECIQIDSSPKSYLYKCVGNQCIDTLRKQYHKRIINTDNFSDSTVANVNNEQFNTIETKQLQQTIHAAIENLPKQCKIIFRLSRDLGLKYQEIANELNISVKTVETQMGRAFKQLRISILQKQHTA